MPRPAEVAAGEAEARMHAYCKIPGTTAEGDGARRCPRAGLLAAVAASCAVVALSAAALLARSAAASGDVWSSLALWQPATFNARELVGVETRDERSVIPMHGVPGRHWVNYGHGQDWRGFITKVDGWLSGARERAAASPDGIIIVSDTDIIDGGCTDAQIFDRYMRIVQASGGAPVVVGTDGHQYPKLRGAFERFMAADFQSRRMAVLGQFGLDLHSYDPWQLTLAEPVAYSFVNSGFIMGPAAIVVRVLECTRVFGRVLGPEYFDDQAGLTRCMARHPDVITMDYSGALIVDVNILQALPTSIWNTLFSDTQCFVHLNGHLLPEMRPWVAWLQGLPNFVQP